MPRRLLLHTCCAPCLIAPLHHLRSEKEWEITIYWFNPNIHPLTEYRRRLDTLLAFAESTELPLILNDDYALENFLAAVAANPEQRCAHCYETRLRSVAQTARIQGFNAFSSTLLYSRYQNHDLIRTTGERIAEELGIPFYYRDFRPLWGEGIERSKAAGMYRQPYCGCIYSEKERYAERPGPRRT
jgi:epoxyqueuosine reductase